MKTYETRIRDVSMVEKVKVETTYEYTTILGGLLGYWKKQFVNRCGADIELHLYCDLRDIDRVIINGEEIPIPPKSLTS